MPITRWHIRSVLSAALNISGVNGLALALRGMRECVLVLCYHRVLDAGDSRTARTERALVTSMDAFARQMEIISDELNPIALTDMIAWMESKSALPARAVLVTFDDGWADTYTNAFPIMRRLAVPGVVFLSTGFIGTFQRYWTDRIYELLLMRQMDVESARAEIHRMKRMPEDELRAIVDCLERESGGEAGETKGENLTWEQVREMASQGFEFGSHTRSHVILPHELGAYALRELNSSAEDIEVRLDQRPPVIAYPDGQYDDTTCRLAAVARYRWAFTCEEGLCTRRSAPLALPRLNIHDGVCTSPDGAFSPAMFLTYLCGTIPWRRGRRR